MKKKSLPLELLEEPHMILKKVVPWISQESPRCPDQLLFTLLREQEIHVLVPDLRIEMKEVAVLPVSNSWLELDTQQMRETEYRSVPPLRICVECIVNSVLE